MSTGLLLGFAALVFMLLLTGLLLSMREFLNETEEPSKVEGLPPSARESIDPEAPGSGKLGL